MKEYNFDEVINRVGRGQIKWEPEMLERRFGSPDLLSFWVADMDFRTPKAVREALVEAANHGVLGYSNPTEEFFSAYSGWVKRRHDWDVCREWLKFSPGVVPGINLMILALTEEGDEVLIQRPVYYPFTDIIEKQHRKVLNNPLRYKDGKYTVDFEDFEAKASSDRCTAFILCNPHNPVGRVYTEYEIKRMADICHKHNIFVIADEIHFDLIMPGNKHFIYAKLGGKYLDNCCVFHAPSKTFNLAGLQCSLVAIPSPKIREKWDCTVSRYSSTHPNYFAQKAAEAAWNEGEEWLEACLAYIEENYKYVKDFCKREFSDKVKVTELEGTYLAWLDFNEICSDKGELERCMLQSAKVALDEGYIFGAEGIGFERINLACPRSLIKELMERIAKAVDEM